MILNMFFKKYEVRIRKKTIKNKRINKIFLILSPILTNLSTIFLKEK